MNTENREFLSLDTYTTTPPRSLSFSYILANLTYVVATYVDANYLEVGGRDLVLSMPPCRVLLARLCAGDAYDTNGASMDARLNRYTTYTS
jgi:hypothetical protein